VVAEFKQFLAADAGQSQNFDRGECPERLVVLVGQVAPFAGGRVFGPDMSADGFGDERFSQLGVGAGDQRARRRLVSGLHELLCGAAALVGGAHQYRQHRQSFAGALVHPSLAVFAFLGSADLGVADRAGSRPLGPSGGIVDSPLGDVEVERSHPY